MTQQPKIGLFDSGLGGLTVLRELSRAVPGADYLYLGDNARAPYGSKGDATIVRYSRECAEFLASRTIDLLVVACNTASSIALDDLARNLSIPVIGTIQPAVRSALEATKHGRVGVIGTAATIASESYQRALRTAAPRLEVSVQPCPLFVPLVEEGLVSGPIVEAVVEHYLTGLLRQQVDTIVLGCTHYPLLVDAIHRFVGPDVQLVECSKAIAKEVETRFASHVTVDTPGTEHYFTTDDVSRFNHLASLFIDRSRVSAARVSL